MANDRTPWQQHMGVGEATQPFRLDAGTRTRHRPVTVEEGPNRGQIGGFHTDHPDGRIDATVTPQPVTVTPSSEI